MRDRASCRPQALIVAAILAGAAREWPLQNSAFAATASDPTPMGQAVPTAAAGSGSEPFIGLQPGLGSLPLLGRGRTRSISAENLQITYVETEVPAAAGTFHAQYRRAATAERNPYVILNGVKGRGRYVGTFLAWTQMT